jgi:hypothetical protein
MPRFDVKREQLLELMPKDSTCAELGVGRGKFSKIILEVAKPKLHFCVDLWGPIATNIQGSYFTDQETWDQRYQDIQDEFKGYNVQFIRDMTYNLPKYCEPKLFDWVYVDGDHTYDGCMKDLQAVKELVKDDGMILGHDYKPAWRKRPDWGVVESVNDFVRENNYYLTVVTQEQFPSYIITKTKERNEEILEKVSALC